jgi:hypothetical protein
MKFGKKNSGISMTRKYPEKSGGLAIVIRTERISTKIDEGTNELPGAKRGS